MGPYESSATRISENASIVNPKQLPQPAIPCYTAMTMDLKREIAQWADYELLDSGNLMKLERFGNVTLLRPEPQALWSPADETTWNRAMATYLQKGDEGSWKMQPNMPDTWTIDWEDLRFHLRLSSFKHIGLFPEQASNWAYLRTHVKPNDHVLNLFGYTGGATLAPLSVGAQVVHVDASKQAVAVAKANAELSGLADRPVRWLVEDAIKFVEREVRREHRYDIIVMNPPAFGRGPNKELWEFETCLLPLLQSTREILHPKGILLVNAYSMGLPAIAVEQAVRIALPQAEIEAIELSLQESTSRGFLVPGGITIRARL